MESSSHRTNTLKKIIAWLLQIKETQTLLKPHLLKSTCTILGSWRRPCVHQMKWVLKVHKCRRILFGSCKENHARTKTKPISSISRHWVWWGNVAMIAEKSPQQHFECSTNFKAVIPFERVTWSQTVRLSLSSQIAVRSCPDYYYPLMTSSYPFILCPLSFT
jgi:hypothetical protein